MPYHKQTLEEKAERHRIRKLERAEAKKLALKTREKLVAGGKQTASKMKARRRTAAVKGLIPNYTEASDLQVDAATIELAQRTLARRRLIEFVKKFHPRYKAGWVHYDICRRLEKFAADVEAGLSPRLMLLMPPRHGKSQLASKLYPAWHLGHYPHHEFIGCSYNISLALDFSREIRDVIKSRPYDLLFPQTKLNPEFMSAEAWRLASRTGVGAGGYNAAGIGGGITGKGAHVLVIDDPVKNAEEAESADIRQKIHDWYKSTAYTRLAPGGGVLIIQTWWHDDDLAGRIQKEMAEDPESDQFEIVKYPAIAEHDEEFRAEGEALHPERYDLEALLRIKRTLGPRYWSALYQQNPITEEGAYFNKGDFVYRDELPPLENMSIYQAWDLAISDDQQKANNWTVGTCIGVDWEDRIHVLERVRLKTNDSSVIENEMIDMYARYKHVDGFGAEEGQIWKTMKTSLKKRMQERRVYIPLDDKQNILQPVKDKLVRARPLQGRMQNKRVTFPRGQAWVDEMMTEFIKFPAGAQDDQIDSLAWAVQLGIRRPPPKKPQPTKNKREQTVAQKISGVMKSQGGGHMAA